MYQSFFSDIGERIGLTLMHSIWQFALVAVLLGIGLRLTRGCSPQTRYGGMFAAMSFMLAASVATFFTVSPKTQTGLAGAGGVIEVRSNVDQSLQIQRMLTKIPQNVPLFERGMPDNADAGQDSETASALMSTTLKEIRTVVADFVVAWMDGILACWLGGVLILSMRPLISWRATRMLRSHGRTEVSDSIHAATARVAKRLGVGHAIEIAQSTLVEVPTVIGWLKPLVLLPASAVIGLSTQQLEAVIAHELAHVRRHDYVVNLFQLLMETVFFYHPAVWWVSYRMRVEREECCDEIAADLTGDRIGYAKLLVRLEETRQQPANRPSRQSLAMFATGGSLLGRVRRLVSTQSPSAGVGPLATAAILVLVAGAICLASFNAKHSFAKGSGSVEPSDSPQVRSWMSRAIELEEWGQLPRLVVRLAENGEYDEAIDWLSKAPLGSTKEGKFSPGTYSKTIGEICQVALDNNSPQVALNAFAQLTDPDGTPRSADWDGRASSAYFRAVKDIRSALLMYYVAKGQLDVALEYLNSQSENVRRTIVADMARKLPGRGHGDQAEAFWRRLSDSKLRDTCRFRLAIAYYHLNQPERVWKLADEIATINPTDLAAEVRTRSTAMKAYSRVSPERFDELLPKMRERISQLPAEDQRPYWEEMALAAARLQRYELLAELSARVPLLVGDQFRFSDLSGRDRHPILFAVTELLKRRQFDQAFSLIDLVDDDAVELAALARVPAATVITNKGTRVYPEDYESSVRRLAQTYRVFAGKHDENTVRSTVPKLPESMNVHLRRVQNPPFSADEVAYLNRDLLLRLGQHTELLIEQGKINEVVELASELLGQGELGFAKWMARELAKTGHAGAFEDLRLKINDAVENGDTKKPSAPMSSWENRRFLALSGYTAYREGQRDLCFEIFMKLDRNWMSPSYVSQVAGAAQRAGDIAFLRRMESSTSPLMREAALSALAMHHVLMGDIDEAAISAEKFDKEFGKGNENWLIYRKISHEKNIPDSSRRIAATKLALRKIAIESKDYAIVARDHAKLLGELFPAKPLPAEWLEELKVDPKLLLQVELEHASGREDSSVIVSKTSGQNAETEATSADQAKGKLSLSQAPPADPKAQRLGEDVHRRITAISKLPSALISTRAFTSYYGDPAGVIGLKDDRSLDHLKETLTKRDFDKSLSTENQVWAWRDSVVVSNRQHPYISKGEAYDSSSERTWDGKRGWYRDSNGAFGRYRSFGETFRSHYFRASRFLYQGDHQFSWVDREDEPNFFRASTVLIEHANYQSLPDEDLGGERCHVIRSIPREEQFWISVETGRLRGSLSFISQGEFTWMHELESTRKLAGRSFDSRETFTQWFDEALTNEQRHQLHCEFLYLNQANQHPHELTVFSEYREIAPGIEMPMTEWRADWMQEGKRYKYNVEQTLIREVSVTPRIEPLIAESHPKKGDEINDWRFGSHVSYAFDPDMPESEIHAMVDEAMKKRTASKKKIDSILKPLKEMLGEPAPNLDGQWIPSKRQPKVAKRKPMLLHFWATWCGPCKNDIPLLNELQENGWAIVGVHATGIEVPEIEKAISDSGIEYPVLLGREIKAAGFQPDKITGYPVMMFPCCVLVGEDGKVQAVGALRDVIKS